MNQGNKRVDLYGAVHKGLRACMAHVLVDAGKMDTTDRHDMARVLESVRHLLHLCQIHLEHEDTFLHGAMLARRPGSATVTQDDHAEHQRALVSIEAAVRAVEQTSASARRDAAQRLYALLARFVAGNYEHMHVEETHNNAILWAEYSDAELLAIKAQLIVSIPPADNMPFLRWIAASVSPAERAELFLNARSGMPPAALDAAVAVVRSHLSERDWFKLQLALAPAAAAA